MRRARATAFVLVLALAGCAATPAPAIEGSSDAAGAYPVTVDNCGYDVVVNSPPRRVIAVKSTSIEMMLALGLADRMLGVLFPDGPYSASWGATTVPPILSDRLIGQEALLSYEPDFVYAGWESNLTSEGVGDRSALARLGIGSLVAPSACTRDPYRPDPLTWGDVWGEISLAGEVFGVPQAAADLIADQRSRLRAVQPDPHRRTALWYSSGGEIPYVGAGSGSPQLVMTAAGLVNIEAHVDASWTSASWESVVAADPDVIVLVDASWSTAETKIARLESQPATAALTAVREHRYLIVPFAAGEAGVRSVEAVETLVAQLAAEAWR